MYRNVWPGLIERLKIAGKYLFSLYHVAGPNVDVSCHCVSDYDMAIIRLLPL